MNNIYYLNNIQLTLLKIFDSYLVDKDIFSKEREEFKNFDLFIQVVSLLEITGILISMAKKIGDTIRTEAIGKDFDDLRNILWWIGAPDKITAENFKLEINKNKNIAKEFSNKFLIKCSKLVLN